MKKLFVIYEKEAKKYNIFCVIDLHILKQNSKKNLNALLSSDAKKNWIGIFPRFFANQNQLKNLLSFSNETCYRHCFSYFRTIHCESLSKLLEFYFHFCKFVGLYHCYCLNFTENFWSEKWSRFGLIFWWNEFGHFSKQEM